MKKNAKNPLVLNRETVKALSVSTSIKTGVDSYVTAFCSAFCQKSVGKPCGGNTTGCPM